MTILDLCGGTGSWSRPYRDAGYTVLVVDPAEDVAADIVADVRTWEPPKGLRVHGIMAAPPCTHLAGSGARWWADKGESALAESLSVVDACLRLVTRYRPAWWALENPVGRLTRYLGPPQYTFDPCDYGDPWTKRTCLWGAFTIPVTSPVEPIRSCSQGSWLQQLGGKSARTKRLRSQTPEGFASAFFRANP
jgi:hypothetical protein